MNKNEIEANLELGIKEKDKKYEDLKSNFETKSKEAKEYIRNCDVSIKKFKVELSHLKDSNKGFLAELKENKNTIGKQDEEIKSNDEVIQNLNKNLKTKMSCDDCQEEMDDFSQIKVHILENCPELNKYISDGEESNESLLEEKFECDSCSYTSAFEECLNLHKADCQELKYACEQCNLRFKTAGLVKRHMKNNHSMKKEDFSTWLSQS